MYPQPELARLTAHKTRLLAGIAVQRSDCIARATRVSRPVAILDRLLVVWRGLAPVIKIAAVPATVVVLHTVLSRLKIPRLLPRWLSPALAIFNALRRQAAPFRHQ